jgi:hypothetical protein
MQHRAAEEEDPPNRIDAPAPTLANSVDATNRAPTGEAPGLLPQRRSRLYAVQYGSAH